MSVSPVCPRCGEPLVVRPGSTAQAWCHLHGAVTPLHHTVLVAHDAISAVTADARVPAWVPDPMPAGWSVTGLAWGGEPGARAIVVDCAGPRRSAARPNWSWSPRSRARAWAAATPGCPGLDPGDVIEGPSSVDVKAAGQHAPLWAVPTSDDRAAFVGEAYGVWLWLVMWPMNAAWLLAEQLELHRPARPHLPRPAAGPAQRAPAPGDVNRNPTGSLS